MISSQTICPICNNLLTFKEIVHSSQNSDMDYASVKCLHALTNQKIEYFCYIPIQEKLAYIEDVSYECIDIETSSYYIAIHNYINSSKIIFRSEEIFKEQEFTNIYLDLKNYKDILALL